MVDISSQAGINITYVGGPPYAIASGVVAAGTGAAHRLYEALQVLLQSFEVKEEEDNMDGYINSIDLHLHDNV